MIFVRIADDWNLKNSLRYDLYYDLSPEFYLTLCECHNTPLNCGESLQLGLVLDKSKDHTFICGSESQNAKSFLITCMKYWKILTHCNAQEVVDKRSKASCFSYIDGSRAAKQVVCSS